MFVWGCQRFAMHITLELLLIGTESWNMHCPGHPISRARSEVPQPTSGSHAVV